MRTKPDANAAKYYMMINLTCGKIEQSLFLWAEGSKCWAVLLFLFFRDYFEFLVEADSQALSFLFDVGFLKANGKPA